VVAIQTGNDGSQFNDIKKIDLIRVVDSPAGRFMLLPSEGGQQ
jgi:hypothetical protein